MRTGALTKSSDILAYLASHPGWVLQHCHGVRFNHWWWVRKHAKSSVTVHCNGNAARAASKSLRLVDRDAFGDSTYEQI